jgi:hypothetical protein
VLGTDGVFMFPQAALSDFWQGLLQMMVGHTHFSPRESIAPLPGFLADVTSFALFPTKIEYIKKITYSMIKEKYSQVEPLSLYASY